MLADGVWLFGMAVLLIGSWRRWRRHAARVRVAGQAGRPAPLRAGPVVLSAHVVDDGERDPAVQVQVTQQCAALVPRWCEQSRQVAARPFQLLLDGGERVRVEPDESVFLAHPLDRTESVDPSTRRRCASLGANEPLCLVGRLERTQEPTEGAYRGPVEDWVLRAPPGGRLLLICASSLSDERKFARLHGTVTLLLGLLLLIVQGGILGSYNLLRVTGRPVVVAVGSGDVHRTRNLGPGRGPRPPFLYHLTAEVAGQATTAQISEPFYRQLQTSPQPLDLSFLAGAAGTAELGPHATAGYGAFILLLVFGPLLLMPVLLPASKWQPWYDRKKVVDPISA